MITWSVCSWARLLRSSSLFCISALQSMGRLHEPESKAQNSTHSMHSWDNQFYQQGIRLGLYKASESLSTGRRSLSHGIQPALSSLNFSSNLLQPRLGGIRIL